MDATVSAPYGSKLLPPLQPAYTLLRQAFGGAAPGPSSLHPLVIWQRDMSAALRQESTLPRMPPRMTALASVASGGMTVRSRSLQRVRQQSQ